MDKTPVNQIPYGTLPVKPKKKESMWRQTFIRLLKNPTARIGMILLGAIVIACIFGPYLTKYSYKDMDLAAIRQAPSLEHFCGTDDLGYDCFTRLLYGGRYSLGLGLGSALLSMVIGIALGLLAGYFGGWVDNLIMRFCDILQAIPGTLLAIIISCTLGVGYINTIIALSVSGIASSIRLLRGQILSIRKEEYLEAAQCINCSPARIMFCHMLPNALSPIIVSVSMSMGGTIMAASGLSFIGLGVQAPTPEWGAMLSSGRNLIIKCPWIVTFPGIMILLTILAYNLIGDGLRDALDPKLKR